MATLAGMVNVTEAHATREHALGTTFEEFGNVYEYYRAGAAVTAKNALHTDTAEGPNDLHHTSAVEQVVRGIAMGTLADNEFGWFCRKGIVSGVNVGTPTAGDPLGSTGTAGRLDTETVAATYSQDEVQEIAAAAHGVGVQALTTAVANKCTVLLS